MSRRLIVHLAPFLQGGAGRAIASLAIAQHRSGDRVIVATSLTGEPGFENYSEYLTDIANAGAELICVDSLFKRDPRLNAVALDAVTAAIGGDRPSIVHAHAAVPAGIGLNLNAPVIETMHGWGRNKTAEQAAQDLSILARVAVVVFPSGPARQEVTAAGGRFRRTEIVPYGIPKATPIREALVDLQTLRETGKRIIVTIGSLTAQKNHAVVIDALPAIARQHDVVAVMIGEGPELPSLRKRAASLGIAERVQFRGYMEQAHAALNAADLLVQPSLTESFGLAVIEAYRAGVPVVASRIPALSEIVGDANCGWMFDPASPSGLADAVGAVLAVSSDERTVMVERARRYFNDNFTIDRMIDRYDAVYSSVS